MPPARRQRTPAPVTRRPTPPPPNAHAAPDPVTGLTAAQLHILGQVYDLILAHARPDVAP